jgi:hypothetical protein
MTVNLVIGNHHGEAASIGGGAAVHPVDSRDVSWPKVVSLFHATGGLLRAQNRSNQAESEGRLSR